MRDEEADETKEAEVETVAMPEAPHVEVIVEETLCCGALVKDEDDPDFGCLLGPLLLSVLIVVCGTASTITSKLQYNTRSQGTDRCDKHDDDDYDDDEKWKNCKFDKPWFQTLVMKLAMSLCFVIAKVTKWYRERQARTAPVAIPSDFGEPLLSPVPDKKQQEPSARAIRLIAYPALTDLVQTVLAQAGLLWVTSSTYQMMRGSVIIFTCALSIRYMGKVMTPTRWAAIAVVCLAIVVVGVAGLLGEDTSGASADTYILGIGLILLGQVVGAVQFVLEEHLMVRLNVTPTLLVGWEGIWGVLYFVVLAPALTYSPKLGGGAASDIWHEDFVDTWVQLTNSDALILLTAISGVALLVYNLVGNMVTKQLSAVMRSILESCRTLGVWITGIVIWYGFDDHDSGEKWDVFSYLELLGFFLLVYGTLAYKDIVPIPGLAKKVVI
ncbi:hypothetical protein CTAYLR_001811 [Chrysophaeum taylorii]|uniref:EamA domain-containing protein n=1 Tax=Chrysophaeum taylorii TaxID=2483200 RepID=A0AAD7XHZ2_9STRA|nr:hypothetical protein CTAYLR_001811 [Chrysophaeum taylorii]